MSDLRFEIRCRRRCLNVLRGAVLLLVVAAFLSGGSRWLCGDSDPVIPSASSPPESTLPTPSPGKPSPAKPSHGKASLRKTSPRDDARRYDGRTLDEWQGLIKSLDFQSPAAARAVPGLILLVEDRQLPWHARRQAALTLGRIGKPAAAGVPVLVSMLEIPKTPGEASVPAWAAKALSLFGPLAAPATPALVRLLNDHTRSPLDRLSCVEALGRIGGAHQDAIPALIRLARRETGGSHDDAELREAAVDGLALIGSAAAPAVPTLIRLTRHDSGRLRKKAAVALGRSGPAAGIAAQSLVELVLFDQLPEVREAATASLARIGDSGESALRKLLTDEDPRVRLLSAAALGRVLRKSEPSVAALTAALQDADATVRIAAAESLWKQTRAADPLLVTILDVLTSENRQLRIRAYRLLIALGPAARPALSDLRRLTHDDRPHVRQVATKALRELSTQKAHRSETSSQSLPGN